MSIRYLNLQTISVRACEHVYAILLQLPILGLYRCLFKPTAIESRIAPQSTLYLPQRSNLYSMRHTTQAERDPYDTSCSFQPSLTC